jgi:hypothetical protein
MAQYTANRIALESKVNKSEWKGKLKIFLREL